MLAVAAWVGLAAWQHHAQPLRVLAAVLLLLSASLTARHPVWGLVVYALAAYSLPRYGADFGVLLEQGLLHGAAGLGLSGLLAWRLQVRPLEAGRALPALARQPAPWLMGALLAWAALSYALSVRVQGQGFVAASHHPASLLHGAVLMALAALALPQPRSAALLAGVLCALPLVRTLLQQEAGIYLDGDLPALAAMVMPLALLVLAQQRLRWPWRLAALAVALGLLGVILAAQNRGAAIGLLLGLLALWINARRRGLWLLVGLTGGAALLVLAPAAYIDRFSVLWDPQARHATASLDRSTVQERKDLWRAAGAAIRERPLLGAGPGRETEALAPHRAGGSRLVAHNSVISMALETGVVGAALYLALMVGALLQLQGLIRRDTEPWRRSQARMVQAALCAYLGIGLVISRHDMALAYLFVGWAVALQATRSGLRSRAGGAGAAAGRAGASPDAGAGTAPRPRPAPPAAAAPGPQGAGPVRTWLGLALLAYALFVVYGSLVPMQLRPMGLDAAWQRFWQLPAPAWASGDRSDWAVNFLLLVPLAFGWRFLQGPAAGLRPLAIVLVLPLLSLFVEFLQLFFPPRNPSFNDVAAQIAGTLAGLGLHALWGRRFGHWLAQVQPQASVATRLHTLLLAYLALLLAYNLMPLDLSISPIEIYRKWRDGRILLLPWGAPVTDRAGWLFELATDVLVWVPVGLLWTLQQPTRRAAAVLGRVALAALAIELAQLLVLSRVSDLADVLLALPGAGLGFGLARYGLAQFAPEAVAEGASTAQAAQTVQTVQTVQQATNPPLPSPPSAWRRLQRMARWAFWVWVLLLLLMYGFPFDFQVAAWSDGRWAQALARAPFQTYFERSEFGALSEIVRRLALFAPAGLLLVLGWLGAGAGRVGLALGLMVGLAVLVEAGQVMLPARVADATDALLQALGGCAGVLLGRWLLRLRPRP